VPFSLAVGEGDAAGEGLAAGPDLTAGIVSVAPLGDTDEDGDGLAAVEVELGAGSQPAAKTIESIVRSSIAVRPMKFVFGVSIRFCLVSGRLKSEVILARTPIRSNRCSHRSLAGMAQLGCTKILIHELRCIVSERGSRSAGAVSSEQWAVSSEVSTISWDARV